MLLIHLQPSTLRDILPAKLSEIAEDYNLSDFMFPSFFLKTGYRQAVRLHPTFISHI
jgi:hypothetical protein